MADEFDRIMELLSLESTEKEAKLEEIFQNSIEFFDHFKYIQQHGSKEEVEKMREKLQKMYQKVQEESSKTSEKSGLTPEQIKEIAADPTHFNREQWEFLQHARGKLEVQNQELAAKVQEKKEERAEELSKSKKTHKTKKKDWLRS